MTATAAPQASKHWPASIYRRPDGSVERGLSPARVRDIVRAGEGELWVAGVLETYLSQTPNRMNRVMKRLAIVWWLTHRQWL